MKTIALLFISLSTPALADYTIQYNGLTNARGIDDAGNIVGNLQGYNSSSALSPDGTITPIPCGSFPTSIVDGVVVGYSFDLMTAVTKGFIFKDGICTDGGGILTDYNNGKATGYSANSPQSAFYGSTIIAYPGARHNRAEGVNRLNIVAGYSQIPTRPLLGARSPLKTIGWLWSAEAGFFKTFPGYQIADVNDLGEVLSAAPQVLFDVNGVATKLPIAMNTWGTWLYEMNNSGDIAGTVRTSGTQYTYSGVVYRKLAP